MEVRRFGRQVAVEMLAMLVEGGCKIEHINRFRPGGLYTTALRNGHLQVWCHSNPMPIPVSEPEKKRKGGGSDGTDPARDRAQEFGKNLEEYLQRNDIPA